MWSQIKLLDVVWWLTMLWHLLYLSVFIKIKCIWYFILGLPDRGGRGSFVRRPRREVSVQLLSKLSVTQCMHFEWYNKKLPLWLYTTKKQYIDIHTEARCFFPHGILCTLCGVKGRGAQDRKDASGSGLDCCLSSGSALQARIRPPPCEDGVPCEGGHSSREERQFGANQGQTSLLPACTQRP